ncbi:hypothetical protein [Sporosarcina sp. P33]|uniref:hypothetical protein n=1 Tax=Sporosarcina sp. P33 TaxID=1930764 RepID=UPI0009C120EE|nr:hypothetical protein [Sporosarcina sp. P33]ARD47559.1 hypothetical protein SporoP33_04450 [Sporosarcina sp. P33]
MQWINRTPLDEVRRKEQSEQAKDAQLKQLGASLTQEMLKNAQKDVMIQQLGKELTELKIKVKQLEGAASQ